MAFPAELLQCATPLQAKHAGTDASGPADAVDRGDGANAEGEEGATHLDADALLGGRYDDVCVSSVVIRAWYYV